MKHIRLHIPHTLVLIFTIMIGVAILTWIVPGGEYERTINADGREVVVNDTFHYVEPHPQGPFDVLQAPLKGMTETASIISFILIVGGVFAIIQKTQVIDASVIALSGRLQGREGLIVPAGMVLFSLFGAIFGMSEEVIPFVLIFIPLALAMGYDSLVGVAIPFLGAGVGFAGALLNPFTIGIAQGIAELPLFSGIAYRFLVWVTLTTIAILAVSRYAHRIKSRPEISPVYSLDKSRRDVLNQERQEHIPFDGRHKLILIWFALAILVMIYGVMRFHWFIAEISAVFLGLGILAGITARFSADDIASNFVAGAQDLVMAAFVVGFARGILVLASHGQIIDTIMNALAGSISSVPTVLSAQLMFLTQTVLNFFVPSGSGQAALTMPIMAPLGDLIGVTRQTAVLAFQLGDGLTNMIIPTSGVTMGVLGLAKIEWKTWALWLLPIEAILFALGLLFLIPPVLVQWGPF